MKVAVGSDHGGFKLKEELKVFIEELGYEVKDYGTYSNESVDYPEYGKKVAQCVAEGGADRGVVICGSGIGISIAANRVKGVRCALVHETYSAKLCREHNNANVIALGGRLIGIDMAKEVVKVFFETQFQGQRHERRISALDK